MTISGTDDTSDKDDKDGSMVETRTSMYTFLMTSISLKTVKGIDSLSLRALTVFMTI